jgi:ABC-type phosphate transport system substrate-binding protein
VRLRVVAVVVALLWESVPSAQAPSFVIVVNLSNPTQSLPATELRRIFMKETRLWPDGESIVPVDWESGSPLRQEFSQRVLGRSVREMAEFWVQQSVTQGLAPPSSMRSALAISRFVANVPGAISYLPPSALDGSVKAIKIRGL